MFSTVQEVTALQLIGTAIPQVTMATLGQGVYSTVLILIFYTSFNMIPKVLEYGKLRKADECLGKVCCLEILDEENPRKWRKNVICEGFMRLRFQVSVSP